jgi:predicted metalloprotease with PDZ domain
MFRNYFVFLSLIVIITGVSDGFARTSADDGLTYKIMPVGGDRPGLQIELSFRGNETGETRLKLPDRFASESELFRGIRDLKVISENASLGDADRPQFKLVKHRPGQEIRIVYRLEQFNEAATRAGRGGGNSPVIRPDYIHFIGAGGWIYPELKPDTTVAVELSWNGFSADWNFANSFGANSRSQKFSTTPERFSSAIFVAGDFRVERSLVEGKPVFTAVRGKWSFTDAEFAGLVNKIVRLEREFWNDFDHPFYLVTLLPLDTDQGMSIGGTGLTNSFATFVSNDAPLERLGWLIAHEYFHNWNYLSFGGLEEPEQLLYWFSEGFTDFYTYRLLLRGGLLDLNDLIGEYNQLTEDYYISPVRNVDNGRILKDFFRDGDVAKIPYRRGFLLATKWDRIIRKQSGGKKSLDDMMRDILRDARRGKFKKLSKDLIASYLTKHAAHDFAADIERYIEKGETIEGFETELGNCVEASEVRLGRYELGFDFASSREQMEIVGVAENSAAYRSGVRNGQKIKGFSFYNGKTEVPVSLTIIEDGAEKKIEYLPVTGEKIAVPRYRLKTDLSQTQLQQCQTEFGVK